MDTINNLENLNKEKEFHFYEKISLITKDNNFYELESKYSKLKKLFKGSKNKLAIEGFGTGEITVGDDNRVYGSLEKSEGAVCRSAIYDFGFWQDNKIEYVFTDQKRNEALSTIQTTLNLEKSIVEFYLDKFIHNGRVSYKTLNEEDINHLGGEDNLKKIQAIMRSIGGHREDIMFRIGPVDYYLINNKLKYKVDSNKNIDINQDHIFEEEINGVKTNFTYVKRDRDGNLSSVENEKFASDNDFSYSIFIKDFRYDKDKKDYSPYFKKVGILYKENEKVNESIEPSTLSNNIIPDNTNKQINSVNLIEETNIENNFNEKKEVTESEIKKVNKNIEEEDIEDLFG